MPDALVRQNTVGLELWSFLRKYFLASWIEIFFRLLEVLEDFFFPLGIGFSVTSFRPKMGRYIVRDSDEKINSGELSSFFDRDVIGLQRTDVNLPRADDFSGFRFPHFLPVRDPPRKPPDGEHDGKHIRRNSERLIKNSAIKIHEIGRASCRERV